MLPTVGLIDKLDVLAEEANIDTMMNGYPIYFLPWEDKTSCTTLFDKSSEDVYMLNSVVAGGIKIYQNDNPKYKVPSDYVGPVIVHRAMLSIGAMSRVETVEDLRKTLKEVLNMGMIDIVNQIGNVMHGYKFTLKRADGGYFHLPDNHAAVEIRILVTKEE